MPEIPILDELGTDLRIAFRARERRRRRVRWAVPVAAVAAGAALLFGLGSGDVAPPKATAAELLRRAAHAAQTAPAPFPRDDQYFYVRSLSTNLMMSEPPKPGQQALVTVERRIWTSVKNRGRLDSRFVSATYPGASTEQKRELEEMVDATAGGPTHDIGHQRYRLGSIKLSRAGMLAFPTDPRTIYERLRAQVEGKGHSPDGEVFTEIGDALRETAVPAGLRAGLYGVLALIPGVELIGDVTDRAGRHGTAVAFTEVGMRNELIFDPATSEMLAERTVLLDPAAAQIPLPKGTVIGDSAYLERAVVDGLPR
jgi:hypothetical protein